MELFEAILKRRSVRKFETKEVPQEVLNDLLEAVRWAPSWANTQCWEVVVVKQPELKKELAAVLSPKNPATPAVEKAPVVMVMCAKLGASGYYKGKALSKFGDWFMFDLGLATQNLCLAAVGHGLGSVVAGALDHDKAKEILRIPDGYEVVALIPIGYPAHEPKAPKRKEISEFVHENRF